MDWLWVLIIAVRGASPEPADRWAATLGRLDHVRAEAFAAADPALLDGVYVPHSSGRAADAATMADYRRRGGRVVGAELRVLSCRVLHRSPLMVRLDVVDRLGTAKVAWRDGSTTDLPRDEASRRVVTLRRTSEGWRIAGVSPRPSSRR